MSLAAIALRTSLAALLLGALACATGPDVETAVYETADGVLVVETVELEAKVVAVDATTREVRLQPPHGKERVFHAGPDVVNFPQIQVGDVVRAVVVDQLAVVLVPGGAPESVGAGAAVALAPEGAKPGVITAETAEITGTVIAIDEHEHTLTLQFVDGSVEEVKVAKSRDLSQVSLGDSVRARVTQAVAIAVEKP